MSYHHRYKPRDFDFAQLLVTLRKRACLTQKDVALWIGAAEKSVRNWEGGSNYPSEQSLRKLIELYLSKHAFAPGQEQDEAHMLWEQLRNSTPRRIGLFDEQWFAALSQQCLVRDACHVQQQEESQPQALPRSPEPHTQVPPASPETTTQNSSPSHSSSRLSRRDWSEMIDVAAWYGRTDEMAELEHWLLKDQCRLVAVLGMGGIGKTALAIKFVQQVAPQFELVLWRSLHNAPPLKELLCDWLPVLAEQNDTYFFQDVDQSLALLIELLQRRRCLLVLDNLETLFQEEVLEGRYREGYEGYAKLIQSVAQTSHQSCLFLTCREMFPDLGTFAGLQAPVRVLRLGGLTLPTSQQMLQDKGLFGDHDAWRCLVQQYAGNPLALKIVAETIRELFGGDIAAFLDEGILMFRGIRQLLAQHFERLSTLEQTLMYWLAIERELITLETLRKDLRYPVSKSEMMEAMHSLRGRSLMERGEHGAVFLLQPVVLEYVTERLVMLISEEICQGKPALLLQYPLLQGSAKDYIRTSQARLIVQPVLDRLISCFGNSQRLEEQLELLLQQLRTLPYAKQGYGGGNIVNLLVRLNGHVRGKDCSDLTIWQADLQEAEAQDATFAQSDLTGSIFTETMNSIMTVALSANGQYLAGGSNTGEIRIWHVGNGQPLQAIQSDIWVVWSLAFNPESTLLVSGGYDGLVKVWEISSGQCLYTLEGHTKWVRSMVFHPEGKLLVTCSQDGSIRFWDFAEGRCVKVWYEQHGEVWSVACSPDGRLLACSQRDGIIKVWDLASEQCLWSITAHKGLPVPSIAFSPDSTLLVSGGEDGTIMVWDASSGEHLGTPSGHTNRVFSVTFSGEGLLASGSHDRTVKLWQVGRKATQCLCTLQSHTSWIWSVAFGPDGLLASSSHDGVVKLWQISRGNDGGKCLRTLSGYSRQIHSLALSYDGELLVSSENNGAVRMWETKSRECVLVSPKQGNSSWGAAFSPDGQLFANTFPEGTIKVYSVNSKQCLKMLRGHQATVWSLAFNQDGRFLASGGSDAMVKWWEISSGRCLITFQGHRSWVWSVVCNPDGTLLASGDARGIVKVWDISSGQCLKTLQGAPTAILALTFASDGTILLSSNAQENLVTLWDIQSGKCLKTIPGIGETYWQHSVAFSTDGSLLATASNEQTLRVWSVDSGQLLCTYSCHAGRPRSVALSADQRLLACGTDEGAIILWERQTGNDLMTLRNDRPYERMNISGVTGLTQTQKASLKILGAIEGEDVMKH